MLTKTEKEVARLNCLGLSRKEIAAKRFRAVGTVQKQLESIHEKTRARNAQELLQWYMKAYHDIDIKKMLQVVTLLIILLPTFANYDNEMIRVRRPSLRTARVIRAGRRTRKQLTS